MKSFRNSPSTDCNSSEGSISNKKLILNSDKNLKIKEKSPINNTNKKYTKISCFDIISNRKKKVENLLKINNTNINNITNNSNKTDINLKTSRFDSSISVLKEKLLIRNKTNKNSQEKIEQSYSSYTHRNNTPSIDFNMTFLSKNNEFIEKQNLRNCLENSILNLTKEINKKKDYIDNFKSSISYNKNENYQITLIQQRYKSQSQFIKNEIQKTHEECVKVNLIIIH